MARRGRPSFKPTRANRDKVCELLSVEMTQEDIARVIGCTVPTLRKHFREELKTGAAVKRAEVIGMLYVTAKKGNASAQRHLEAMTRVSTAAAAMRARGEETTGAGASAPEEKLGKKAAAKAAAGKVEGTFAPAAPPVRLAVNNT